mgnify:FL=1|tara:strand:- start:328 stop:888 length:561 start_codon:yes stop_codon:yes gene_type:complete
MTIKWTDKIKMQMREDFVNGVYNADGVIEWLSMDALIKKYRVARATAYKYHHKERWQQEKNRVQTQISHQRDEERTKQLIDEGKQMDLMSMSIAKTALKIVANRYQKCLLDDSRNVEALGNGELQQLSVVATNAQRIAKLALGEAQEISKIAADVSTPESFRRIMETLDRVAEDKAGSIQNGRGVH